MKYITQTELVNLIKEKQENAKNMFYETKASEKDFGEAQLKKARLLGEMDVYLDLICYLKSVVIVPDGTIKTTIPKVKQEELGITQDELKKFFEKTTITPYIEPKVEPLRNDRIREFERTNDDETTTTATVDAKEVSAMVVQLNGIFKDTYEVLIFGNGGVLFIKRFIEEPRAKAYYNDLVEWWKYWKQN